MHLSRVLASLEFARQQLSTGRLKVELHLSQAPAPELIIPPRLPHSITVHTDLELLSSVNGTGSYKRTGRYRYELAGAWRTPLADHVRARRFDYFLVSEDDLNVTLDNLGCLCQAHDRLAGTHYAPALAWYEVNGDGGGGSQRGDWLMSDRHLDDLRIPGQSKQRRPLYPGL